MVLVCQSGWVASIPKLGGDVRVITEAGGLPRGIAVDGTAAYWSSEDGAIWRSLRN